MNKMLNCRIVIIKKGDITLYYPQYRRWFGWASFYASEITGSVFYDKCVTNNIDDSIKKINALGKLKGLIPEYYLLDKTK